MKKILFLLLISINIFAQKSINIPLKQSIKDKTKMAKSLTVLDFREDKTIGDIIYRKDTFNIQFEEQDLKNKIETWFDEDNKTKGNKEFYFVIDKIKVSQIPNGKSFTSKIELNFASFIKKLDKYYFVNRTKKSIIIKPTPNDEMPRLVASKIGFTLTKFITNTYDEPESKMAINESDLTTYEAALNAQIKSLQTDKLTDGVYKDFTKFSNQETEKNYFVKKNKKGEVTGVGDIEGYDVFRKNVYAYVENGVPYLLTPVSFWQMQKDEKGFYLYATREILNPEHQNNAIFVGVLAGGIVGGIVGGIIDASITNGKKDEKKDFYNIYIDSLTGELLYEK